MILFIEDNIFENIEFFDGETISDKYLLLGNSQRYLFNENGINYKDAIIFLYENAKEYNYFFRMDYDINMIFKDLNDKKIIDLFNNKKIKIKINKDIYYLQYFRHKIFIIEKNNKQKIFYDVFNFFQTSFVKVMEILELDKKFKREYEFIKKYKLERERFTKKILKQIIEYNKTECIIGKYIVIEIYNLLPKELKTLKLYGSSSITNLYLLKNEIDKKNKKLNLRFLKNMFYGGRIETFKVGKFVNVYKYDINSAYPYVINNLREIISIKKSSEKDKIIETDIYKIELKIENEQFIGLLPIRLKNGLVVYPNEVKGYYYGVEVKMVDMYAKKYDFIKYKILERYEVKLGNRLFNDIENLYNLRLELKKKKDKRNLIYKILLNSIYGKFAQKVGKNIFNNYYYAGLITASIRAKLLIDFIDVPNDIIFIATDGVLVKKKNNNVKINDRLGNYEEVKIKEAFVIMSGVYYLIDYNNNEYIGMRGFHIDYKKVIPIINEKGKVEIFDKVFITNVYAIKNYKKFGKNRCKIITISKVLDIENQIKRKFIFNINSNYLENNFDSFILTKKDLKKVNNIIFENLELYFDFNFK